MQIDANPEPAIIEDLDKCRNKMTATYNLIQERAFEQENFELLNLMKNLESKDMEEIKAKFAEQTEERILKVLEHIQNVQRNCYKLGLKLIADGHVNLGRNLIANGQIHDNSKLRGIEFDHLIAGSPILGDVIKHHQSVNMHHPEYWHPDKGIHNMPELYIAEMVCDCVARGQEFGTNPREWLLKDATKKYGFEATDQVGKSITYYLDLLLEKPFKKE